MIAYIKGVLQEIQEDKIIVDVSGVGYEIFCANPFVFERFFKKDVFIHTYHHVREDAQILYGFRLKEEKDLFLKLISVSGIGPKSASTILSDVNVLEFVQAVEEENEKFLRQFPGVGKKTAQQIILDLKGKLTSLVSEQDLKQSDCINVKQIEELIETLQALGYVENEINKVLPELKKDANLSLEELTKKALALLVKH